MTFADTDPSSTRAQSDDRSSPSNPTVHRLGGLIEAEVDGELVALHVEKGTCYGFNGTATRIWGMIAEPRSVSALRDTLVAEFDVEPDACEVDLRALLSELEADGLVELREGTASA